MAAFGINKPATQTTEHANVCAKFLRWRPASFLFSRDPYLYVGYDDIDYLVYDLLHANFVFVSTVCDDVLFASIWRWTTVSSWRTTAWCTTCNLPFHSDNADPNVVLAIPGLRRTAPCRAQKPDHHPVFVRRFRSSLGPEVRTITLCDSFGARHCRRPRLLGARQWTERLATTTSCCFPR